MTKEEKEVIQHARNTSLLSEIINRIKSGVIDEDAAEILLDNISAKKMDGIRNGQRRSKTQ